MQKIAIIQKYIPQYRREFFVRLREELRHKNIDLLLIYGQPNIKDALKNDAVDLDWAVKVPNKIIKIGRKDLFWQPVFSYLQNVDLVIVEQASKLLINYLLILQNRFRKIKLAFWGHGKNFQEQSANRLGEWIKQKVSNQVHWWFAYTNSSAQVVINNGFPFEKVTVVQNTVDTLTIHDDYLQLSKTEINKAASELGLKSRQVGLFVGGMYPEKKLSFLMHSLYLIKKQIPDFEMIFLGNGIEASIVQNAAQKNNWIHYVGTKFDHEKLSYFALAKILLVPYSAGLVILDSFALETPLIAVDSPLHGPEISYVTNGNNGKLINSPCSSEDYANEVVEVLNNQQAYDNLVNNCRISFKTYTIEKMVANFVDGIEKALSTKV